MSRIKPLPADATPDLKETMEIVEIAAAVAFNGFLNRWNDTMAIPLEPEPIEFGEKYLKRHGWKVGKHKP
jgi:hypothetical protein